MSDFSRRGPLVRLFSNLLKHNDKVEESTYHDTHKMSGETPTPFTLIAMGEFSYKLTARFIPWKANKENNCILGSPLVLPREVGYHSILVCRT